MHAGIAKPDSTDQVVGRDAELAELAGALRRASAGQGGSSWLILGEAGIGKTTLVDATAMLAREKGFGVARGWCAAVELPPFWAWRRALRMLGAPDPFGTAGDLAAGESRPAHWLFAEIVETVEDLARQRPVLVVLEDVHWADDGTVALCAAVAAAASDLPIVMLATARTEPGETRASVRAALASLPPVMVRRELRGLDQAAVGLLAHAVTGRAVTTDEAGELLHRTAGNPLFVRELARLADATGRSDMRTLPAGVREVLQRRVARLSQDCWRVIAAAALLGDAIDPNLLADLAAVSEAVVVGLLDEAADAGLLIRHDAERYRFEHALVREVLETGLPAGERRRLHRRAAELTESTDDPVDAEVARHWTGAGGAEGRSNAARWWLRAARRAAADMAYPQAGEYYRLSLQAVDRADPGLLNELGEVQRLAGDVAGALISHLAAADAARADDRADELARAALGYAGGVAGFEVEVGEPVATDLLARAEAALPAGDSALRALVTARRSLVDARTRPADRVETASAAVGMARRLGDHRTEIAALAAYCDAIAGPAHQAERERAARRMVTLGADIGDVVGQLLGRRVLVVALCERGAFTEVEAEITAYRARTGAGSVFGWLPTIWTGMRAVLVGDDATALRCAAEVGRIAAAVHSTNAALMSFTLRMQVHQRAGTAADMVDEVRAVMAPFSGSAVTYRAAPHWLLLSGGDQAPGAALLEEFVASPADATPVDSEWLEGHWALAEIALRLGDLAAVGLLYERLRPYESVWVVDGLAAAVFGVTGHLLGRLAHRLDRPEWADYLRRARAAYVAAGTTALLRDLDADLAPQPPARSDSVEPLRVGTVRRRGRTWELTWQGRTTVVADGKGIRDLIELLRRPGRQVPAVDLAQREHGGAPVDLGGDLGPVLDRAARAAYRARLRSLEGDIAAAERDADLGRVDALRTEFEFLVAELGRATGLDGRSRTVGDPAERARKAVTMRLRAAITAIGREDEALGRHLTNAVRTGRECVYQPDDRVQWRT